MTAAEPTGWSPARGQARIVLAFLALALGLIAGIDALARDRGLERWLTARSGDLSVRTGKLFSNNGNFVDYEERMLLDELPAVDFTQPAIYFFGTSNMKWAFTTWDLPEGQRRRLHDFGTGAASHQTVLRLIRYLGDKGLWAAGARNEVVLGVSYHLGVTETPNSFFPALVRRDDLYAITPDDRLIDVPRAPLDRWLRTEKARSAGLLLGLWRLAGNGTMATLRPSRQPPHDAATYRQGWRAYMGPDWQANIDP